MASSDMERGDFESPPPSYDSLYGKVRQAHQNSTGSYDFMKSISDLLVGTIGFTILIATSMGIPIAAVVIGSIHLHHCPIQHYIPIYLIVSGAFGIVRALITLGRKGRRQQQQSQAHAEEGPSQKDIDAYNTVHIIDCFLLCWTITGAVWVYGAYKPDYDDSLSPNYCHYTAYMFGFVYLTVTFVLVLATVCCCCCVAVIGGASSSS